MATTTEVITYDVYIDNEKKSIAQTETSYDISGLQPGDHTIKVEGKCQHGIVESATLSFSIHANYTITINPYAQGAQTITWTATETTTSSNTTSTT